MASCLGNVHDNRHKTVVCVAVKLEVINNDDDDVLVYPCMSRATLLSQVANVQLIITRQRSDEGGAFSRVCVC